MNNHLLKNFGSLLLLAALAGSVQTQAQPTISLQPVITGGLNAPMQLVHAGDGSNRIFIVQKGGTILSFDASYNPLSTFLTVTNLSTTGERGLLSMAFHPAYASNGFFFVYYTNSSGDLELARYHVSSSDPNLADAASKVILITIPHPTNANHNGGELHFGNDGYLYLSTGDGGGAGDQPGNAQNTAKLLGKILRFDVNTAATAPYYTVPASNPFGNEVYALGLRNPYRWSFDRQTHDMWIGDVGQDSWEEINYRRADSALGANYGWRCYEGNTPFNTSGCSSSGYIFPVHTYATQNPAASITGGIVYRGSAYSSLQGVYLAADFYSGIFYKIIPNGTGGWTTATQTLSPTGIVDFGETENGEAYVVSNTGNSVLRITAPNNGVNTINGGIASVNIYPTVITDGSVHIHIASPVSGAVLELTDMSGRSLLRQDLGTQQGDRTININSHVAPGMYMARISIQAGTMVQKLLVQ